VLARDKKKDTKLARKTKIHKKKPKNKKEKKKTTTTYTHKRKNIETKNTKIRYF
jgi:hypothetical protein